MYRKSQEEITKNWIGNDCMVSICCLAYNHERFIEEALNSFLMQETTFPFEILIHDDASTDRTADIIRAYADRYPIIFKPLLQTENQYSKLGWGMNSRFNFPRAKGKYIAFCEGDDYWIDPYKLHEQVNLMENTTEYTYCGAITLILKNNKLTNLFFSKYDDLESGSGFNSYRFFKSNALLIRWDKTKKIFEKYKDQIPVNEYTINCMLYEEGRGIYYKKITSVYRANGLGIWSSLSKLERFQQHYTLVKPLRKYLKKNWSFYALQEIVTFFLLICFEFKKHRTINLLKSDWKNVCVLSFKFLFRFGFITSLPPLYHWIKERRKIGIAAP